jgi:hypothetical protein
MTDCAFIYGLMQRVSPDGVGPAHAAREEISA